MKYLGMLLLVFLALSLPSFAHTVELQFTDADSSVDHYNIYRTNVHGGVYTVIGTSTDTHYIDTTVVDRNVYYYVVTAVYANGDETGYSNCAVAPVAWLGPYQPC